MVQKMNDSKSSEFGLHGTETGLPSRNKQTPVSLRKIALRDLQNDNRIMVSKGTGNSPFSKERGSVIDAICVSGTKRSSPECPVSPHHHHQSQSSNGHLAHIRRKSEAKVGKSSTCDGKSNNSDTPYLNQLGHQEETTQPKLKVREAKFSSFSALTPFPGDSLESYSSGKPSIPFPLGKSAIKLPLVESSHVPIGNNNPSPVTTKRRSNQHWEERSLQLQKLLSKLDQLNQVDYLEMLRSLSSVELSRHAVELEKWAIQLALEEGQEMERVVFLNVFGLSPQLVRAQSTQ